MYCKRNASAAGGFTLNLCHSDDSQEQHKTVDVIIWTKRPLDPSEHHWAMKGLKSKDGT